MAAVTKDDDEPYDGPYLDELQCPINDDEQPTRSTVIKPRTLAEVLLAATARSLDPYTSENGRWVGFDCPMCQVIGRKAAATIINEGVGLLRVECAGCHDEVAPGILETLGTPYLNGSTPDNVVQLHPEQNSALASVRHLVELLDLDDILANPPPDPTFAWGNEQGGYSEVGTLTVLHGDGGLGKSLIAQGLCRRYTLGKEWLNQSTGGGVALYLDGENSLAEIARRLYSFDVRPGERNLKYGRVSFPILLEPIKGEQLVDQLVAETGCTLLVLDSQRALWGGDEKEQLEVQPLYEMLARAAERLQIAILLIHHDNKSGGYSGSTAINAAVTSRIHLERFNKDRKDRRRILWHEKSRSGPEQEPVIFSVDKTHDGILTFQLFDDDTGSNGPTPGIARDLMRQRLLDVLSDGTPRTRAQVGHEIGLEPSNGTLRRTWETLHKEGALTSSDNLHWTPK